VPGRAPWRCVLDSLRRRKPPIRYTGPALGAIEQAHTATTGAHPTALAPQAV